MSQEGSSPAFAGRLKRLAPYLIAVAAVAWVLHATDLHKLAEAMQGAPLGLFVTISAVMLVLNCAADTFAMRSVFGWFGCPVPYRELFFVRASTYLLAIVNYHVGQAAIVGYLYKAQRVPFLRATGWILFIIGVNVGTLFLLASTGAARAEGELAFLRLVPVATGIGVVVYAALLALKPRLLADRALLSPLFEMGIAGHALGVLVRLPHVGVLLVWHFLSLRMFGVEVPATTALLYLPAYFAVSSLPVSVNGIGVPQIVAVAFFGRYVPATGPDAVAAQKAAVLAYSFATAGVSIFLQVGIGFLSLRRVAALGLDLREASAPASVTQQAASQS